MIELFVAVCAIVCVVMTVALTIAIDTRYGQNWPWWVTILICIALAVISMLFTDKVIVSNLVEKVTTTSYQCSEVKHVEIRWK